jgi:UDP-GlcNAc:undecaprenyl-phosphate GlcNAc-1-phosphate transferase
MAEAGYGPAVIGISLAGFSFFCGGLAAMCMVWNLPQPLMLAAYFALAAFWFWLTMRRERAVGFFRRLRSRRPPQEPLVESGSGQA